jgi:transposase-like protein
VTKNRSTFVNDEAIFKTLYLAIRNASAKWTMPIKEWGLALNQFAIVFGKERVPFRIGLCHLHTKNYRLGGS